MPAILPQRSTVVGSPTSVAMLWLGSCGSAACVAMLWVCCGRSAACAAMLWLGSCGSAACVAMLWVCCGGSADNRRDALARLLWERRLRRDALALLWERRQASRLLAGSAFATQATLPQLPLLLWSDRRQSPRCFGLALVGASLASRCFGSALVGAPLASRLLATSTVATQATLPQLPSHNYPPTTAPTTAPVKAANTLRGLRPSSSLPCWRLNQATESLRRCC